MVSTQSYFCDVPINIKICDDENNFQVLKCDKVVYEISENNCLVLESTQSEIIVKLSIFPNPKCLPLEKLFENNQNEFENQKLIIKEFNLLRCYSRKKPEYFINVFQLIPLMNIDLGVLRYHDGNYLVCGYTMEKMYSDLKLFYFKEKNKLGKEELFKYWDTILKILSYMQTEGLCHRDIKLQNIFIDNAGNLKLGDFGTSKELERKNLKLRESIRCLYPVNNLTTYIGTEIYMAPEIYSFKNEKFNLNYNPFKSDLFSAGITILNLITGNLNNLTNHFEDVYCYKEKLKNLMKNFSTNIKEALYLMLEYEEDKRPDIIQFYENHFKIIFKQEISQKNFSNFFFNSQSELTKLNTSKIQDYPNDLKNKNKCPSNNQQSEINETIPVNRNKIKEIKLDNPILIRNKDSNNNEGNLEEVDEYNEIIRESCHRLIEEETIKQKINKNIIELYDEKSIYFTKNNDKTVNKQINLLCFLGLFVKKKCIFKKFKFINKEIANAFCSEINFILNMSLNSQISTLVRYLSVIKEASDIYLVSEYVKPPDISLELKSGKKEFYNLFTLLVNQIKLADFFKKDEFQIKIMIIKEVVKTLIHIKTEFNICFADLDASKILITKDYKIKLKDYLLFDIAFKFNGMLGSYSNFFVTEKEFVCLPPEFYINFISKEKSDMWGLGILIHQIFNYTKNPWGISRSEEYLTKVALNPLSDDLDEIKYENIPHKFVYLIKNLLKRNYEKRLSLEEVKQILDKI